MTDESKQDPGDEPRQVEQEEEQEQQQTAAGTADHLADRVLCPDGACIGVIGPDGRCKVCGTALDPEQAPKKPARDDDSEEEDFEDEDEDDREEEDDDSEAEEQDDWDDEEDEEEEEEEDDVVDDGSPLDLSSRVLCSDGACIGVIGPDGRCKECGKPYTGDAADTDGDDADEPAEEDEG